MAAPDLVESRDEDGFTPLHLAVIAGNMPLVTFLLANKADVNAVDNEKHTVVHWATVCGETAALRAVLAAGAPVSTPDVHGGYPLHYAAQMCGGEKDSSLGLQVLQTLLTHSDIVVSVEDGDGRQPLLWGASAGSAKAVLALIRAGATVEASDKDGLTALHCAASRGHTDCIDSLLTLCGASPDVIDSNGCTALHYAVTLGHADATALLLAHGADPNRQDRKGRTPAHCGCAKGQFETVKMIGAHGANLWLRNARGDLPLHEAAASGRRDLVRWLLDMRPSQVNARNNDGRCPLHLAALNDNADMCKILLDAGAQINPILRTSKNTFMTPLDCALQRGFRSTAKYLQLHGGVPANRLGDLRHSQIKPGVNLQIKEDVTFWSDTSSDSERENGEVTRYSKRIQRKKLSHKYEKKRASISGSDVENNKLVGGKLDGGRRRRFGEKNKRARTGGRSDSAASSDMPKHGRKASSTRIDYTNEIVINGKTEINFHNTKDIEVEGGDVVTTKLPSKLSTEIAEKVLSEVAVEKEKRPKSAKNVKARDKSAKSSGKEDSVKKKGKVERPNSKHKQGNSEQSKQKEVIEEKVVATVVDVENKSEKSDSLGSKEGKHIVSVEESYNTQQKLVDQQSLLSNTSEDVEEHKSLVVEAAIHEPPKTSETVEVVEEKTDILQATENEENVEQPKQQEEPEKDGTNGELKKDVDSKQNLDKTENQDHNLESIAPSADLAGDKEEESTNEKIAPTGDLAQDKQTETKIETEDVDNTKDVVQEETEANDKASEAENVEVEENTTVVVETNGITDGDLSTTVEKVEAEAEVQKSENGVAEENIQKETEENKEEPVAATDKANETTVEETPETETTNIETTAEVIKNEVTEEVKIEPSTTPSNGKEEDLHTEPEKDTEIAPVVKDEEKQNDVETAVEEKNETINEEAANGKKAKKEKHKKKTHRKKRQSTEDQAYEIIYKTLGAEENDDEIAERADDKEEKLRREKLKPQKTISETKSSEDEYSTDLESGSSTSTSATVKEHKSFRILDEQEAEELESRNTKTKKVPRKRSPPKKQRSRSEESKKFKTKMKESDRTKRSKVPASLTKTHLSKSDKYLNVPDRKTKSSMESRVPSLPNINESKDRIKEPPRSDSNLSAPLLASAYSDEEITASDVEEEEEEQERSSATRRKKLKRKSKTREAKSAGSDYESSNVIDSGFEPSPRSSRIPKWKNMSERGVNMTSVTQSIQSNIRRYHLERKIFQHLLDLKRLQIRAGQHNEAILVKRAIDTYHQSCASTVGAGRYVPEDYTFRSFEKFLYLSLRKLQRNGADHLKGLPESSANPLLCTQSTHRCMHATHAYTGIPCAAYLPKMDHHTIPKIGFTSTQCKPGTGFLPTINPKKAVTLELCHGNDKQVISLPADRLDQNKRYYVTFTVKGSEGTPPNEEVSSGHRHSKSD
ncbi:ankyrin repeat domain-containing protein 12 isoform X2 [Zophobas morio]